MNYILIFHSVLSLLLISATWTVDKIQTKFNYFNETSTQHPTPCHRHTTFLFQLFSGSGAENISQGSDISNKQLDLTERLSVSLETYLGIQYLRNWRAE